MFISFLHQLPRWPSHNIKAKVFLEDSLKLPSWSSEDKLEGSWTLSNVQSHHLAPNKTAERSLMNIRRGGTSGAAWGRAENSESAGTVTATFTAGFTETSCFCRSIVRPFSPAPSNSTLHRTSFSHQNARGCADAFIRCNAICGGWEEEPLALGLQTARRHKPCMRKSFPPLDKLNVKHTEVSQMKPRCFRIMNLQGFCPSTGVNGRKLGWSSASLSITVDHNNLSYHNGVSVMEGTRPN